jgi:cell division protein FtsB
MMVGLLAPIAFVFAIAALTQLNTLKKEVSELKTEINQLKKKDVL